MNLQTPYSIQSAASIERLLPKRSTIAATLLISRSLHTLRQRNINAPICSNTQDCSTLTIHQIQLLRPDSASGNIYQVESGSYSNTQQVLIRFNTRLNPLITLFANYTLSFSKGTNDSFSGGNVSAIVSNFPAYSYDLNDEYAPSSFIARNSLFISSSVNLPWGFRMNPTVMFSSGRQFNIVTGLDTNRDSVFTERPTYTVLSARCEALGLTNSFCNTEGISNPDTMIIPRNYGKGSGSFIVNMNLSKTFGFSLSKSKIQKSGLGLNNQTMGNNQTLNRRAGSRSVSIRDRIKPYNLTIGVNIQNLLNNVNFTYVEGNLSSPFFGRAMSAGGSANRRIELSASLNF